MHLMRAYVVAIFLGEPVSGRALKVMEMHGKILEDYFPLNHASKDVIGFLHEVFGTPCKSDTVMFVLA